MTLLIMKKGNDIDKMLPSIAVYSRAQVKIARSARERPNIVARVKFQENKGREKFM